MLGCAVSLQSLEGRLIVVNTRCVYYHHSDLPAHHKDNMTLAPLIDMINHSSANTENVSVARVEDSLEIRSLRDIQEGEEVTFSYHSANARFWVCEYGFWLEDNDYDDLDISKEIQDLIINSTEHWLSEEGYWGFVRWFLQITDYSDYTIAADGEVSFRIQVALRAVILDPRKEESMLREFMEGRIDGNTQQHEIDELLKKILKHKIQECEKALATVQRSCIEAKTIQLLLESEMSIAQVAYRHLNVTQ
jgi:hypothetical protein